MVDFGVPNEPLPENFAFVSANEEEHQVPIGQGLIIPDLPDIVQPQQQQEARDIDIIDLAADDMPQQDG
jgi:hypothetical protein